MRSLRRFLLAALFAAAALPARAADYLWEVSSLTNRIYLYGTVHAGRKDWYPLPPAVEKAYADSTVLVVEADITDQSAMARTSRASIYAPPATLATHMPAEQYVRFRRLLARYGIAEENVIRLKPFIAVSILVFAEWARNGYTPDLGVDGYLIGRAKTEIKPVLELEGVDAQIKLMDSLTEKENQEVFKGTIDALESGLTAEQIKSLVAAWRAGDPKALLETARRYNDRIPGAAEFEEKFVWSRHDEMVTHIAEILDTSKERHFVAVGALHLAGPRGLVELLRKRGYVVKQL
jgi:uncharacterized protein